MATIYNISPSDTATEMAEKVNDSMSNLKYAVEHSEGSGGSGGGSSTSNDVISRNADAVNHIQAAKKHFDDRTLARDNWSTNTHQGCFCLAHASDFHSDATRYRNFRDFIDGVDLIDSAIVTGDITDAGTTAQMEAMLDVTFNRVTPMQVIGNHERWDGKTVAQVAEGLGMPVTATGGYYYKDFTDIASHKIRVIVLNEYDTAFTDKANAAKDGVFSADQITWLLGVLDDAITNGCHVLIARHGIEKTPRTASNSKGFWQRSNPWNNNYSYVCSGTIIEDIVAAFMSGGTINQTYTYSNKSGDINADVTINHTFSATGRFIAFVVGHAHIDNTGFSSNHSNQLYLCCPASCYYYRGGGRTVSGASVSDLPRFENTKSEDAFNIYAFDIIENVVQGVTNFNYIVKVVRIGADVNDLMESREMAYYNVPPT